MKGPYKNCCFNSINDDVYIYGYWSVSCKLSFECWSTHHLQSLSNVIHSRDHFPKKAHILTLIAWLVAIGSILPPLIGQTDDGDSVFETCEGKSRWNEPEVENLTPIQKVHYQFNLYILLKWANFWVHCSIQCTFSATVFNRKLTKLRCE